MNVFELIKEKMEETSFADIDEQYADDGQRMLFLYEAISIVDEVQKEYNNGWIPCSERLPSKEEFLKDDGRFIVTDGNRRYESCYDIYTHCFKTLKLFNFNSDGRNSRFEYDRCVIAWQPLPAPYKEGYTDEYIKGYNQGTIDRADEIQKAREYGYNKAINEYMNALCEHCMQQTNECYKLECPFCTDGCDIVNIAEQLKGGNDNV